MRTAVTIVQMLVRLTWVILLILGILFWTGHATNLIPDHIWVGLLFVLLLWALCVIALAKGVERGFAVFALIWGLITFLLGVMQLRLMPGGNHWVIDVLHLLVGVAAIGLAERLGAGLKRSLAAVRPA